MRCSDFNVFFELCRVPWTAVPGDGRIGKRFPFRHPELDRKILVEGIVRPEMTWWLPRIAKEGVTPEDLYQGFYDLTSIRDNPFHLVGSYFMICERDTHGYVGMHGEHLIPFQVNCLQQGHSLVEERGSFFPCLVCGGRASVPVL